MFFGLFWHFILYNLDIYSSIICLFKYLVVSCVLMVILIILWSLYMTQLSQELLSEQHTFTLLNALVGSHSCFCINSLIYMLQKHMYDFIITLSLVKSLKFCF